MQISREMVSNDCVPLTGAGKLFIVIFFSIDSQTEITLAIAICGTFLVLMSLICTVVVVYRYTYMCRPR